MAKAVGIDLGTTFSEVAVLEGGEPVVITSAEGSRLVPSVVAISKNGERLVGQIAKRQAIVNPENTIYSIKRFMGRKWGEPAGRELPVEEDARRKTYKVTKAPNNDVRVVMGGKECSPPEISAMILQKLKTDAEAYLGDKVTEAVITVPAYFNDSQRQATKDAGTIAGLNVLRIINEPTAASLAYRLGKEAEKEEIVAVYDLGGGTFDISILEIGPAELPEGGIAPQHRVLATAGDTHLGGDDFDQRIMDWLCNEFKREQGIDLRQDKMALQRLKEAAEKAKCELSTVQQTEVNLPFITADASGPKHLSITLTRAKLEQLVMDLVDKSLEPCWQALTDAGMTTAQIDDVIRALTKAGEATVQTDVAIQELTSEGKTTIQINKLIQALTNARKTPAQIDKLIQALTKAGKITAQIDEVDEVILVGGQTRMPLVYSKVKQLFGKEPHKGVNPDEVVAIGAAIQAGVLKGDVKDVLLLDVTPLTLGIETLGGVATPLTPRNTTIPTTKSQIFSTAADNQPSVEIHVLQGERPMAADNRTLGRFMLDGILPAPRGVPQIEVTFDIDVNGILNVKAHDKGTGKEQKITITASSGLSKEEVEQMQREAERHAAEDTKRREEVEARNAADTLAYTAEKTLREQKDKIPSDLNQEVENKIAAVRSALQGGDINAVRRATQELSNVMQKIGAAIYQQQPPPPPPGKEGDGEGGEEGTVEGEFREV